MRCKEGKAEAALPHAYQMAISSRSEASTTASKAAGAATRQSAERNREAGVVGTEVRRTPKQGVPHWPAETQLQTQNYGSSFDSLFGPAEPERVRYGVPQQQSSFPNKASVGQAGQPFLTVQCGKFTAPVQREARQLHQEWAQQGHRHSFDELRGPKVGTYMTPVPL